MGNVACMVHVLRAGFWWGELMERDQLEGLGVDGRVILKWIFKAWDRELWDGLVRLTIGTGRGRL